MNEEKRVWIIEGQWKEKNVESVRDRTEWEVEELNLQSNLRVEIIKDICRIHFTEMTKLCIWGNEIESIEELVRIRMPHLACLHISTNHIRSVRALRKGFWPFMTNLYIYKNYSCDNNTIVECHFPCLKYLGVHGRVKLKKQDKNVPDPCFLPNLKLATQKNLVYEYFIQQQKEEIFALNDLSQ